MIKGIEMNDGVFREVFQGFGIIDCALRSKNVACFLLNKLKTENGEPQVQRVVNLFLDRSGDGSWGYGEYTGFLHGMLAASEKPKSQAIAVNGRGSVVVIGSGFSGLEKPIPLGSEGKLDTSCRELRTVDGYVYAAGPWRSVCRRIEADRWERVGDRSSLPSPPQNEHGFSIGGGFDTIDGFSASDIYAGGGEGDVWRFDGNIWHQCAIPTNMLVESICCAGDGYVYIGLQSGSVLKGRENSWKMIYKGKMTLPFKDMVWFDEKVWCTSDYGVWNIQADKVEDAKLPSEIRSKAGNLAVHDGVMLLAGLYGAALFDGKDWEIIVDSLNKEKWDAE